MVGQQTHRVRSCHQRHGRCAENEQCENGQTRQTSGRNKNHKRIS
jgi:hypothetical protein